MGAYENPPLFKIPNYGQIFQQSFQAAQKQTQAAFDRIAQREKERKAEAAAERREKEAQFKDLASFSGALGKIDAGSATLALQNTTGDMTKEYAELQKNIITEKFLKKIIMLVDLVYFNKQMILLV